MDAWLAYIQTLHPREIELGLVRVRNVAASLAIQFPEARVITVAGTNGKGSCVAILESLLLARGFQVGTYTSPHLHHYNERIRVNGLDADDQAICTAFAAIEAARSDTPLTYFEFGTLAALLIFQQAGVEFLLLEVGLGGRLDAVNIVDADVALISGIALDHQNWLGPDRESIGFEKSGIARQGRPLVCGDRNPPASLLRVAAELDCPWYRLGQDFDCGLHQENWWWRGKSATGTTLYLETRGQPRLLPDMVATALQAACLADPGLVPAAWKNQLMTTIIPGRFERLLDPVTGTAVLFDVAHNPQAAVSLAERLQALKNGPDGPAHIHLVLAMMADKDVQGFCQALDSVVDIWYISQVDQERCMRAEELARQLESAIGPARIEVFADVISAYSAASATCASGDLVLVTGSFFTVSEVRSRFVAAGAGT